MGSGGLGGAGVEQGGEDSVGGNVVDARVGRSAPSAAVAQSAAGGFAAPRGLERGGSGGGLPRRHTQRGPGAAPYGHDRGADSGCEVPQSGVPGEDHVGCLEEMCGLGESGLA